MKRWVPLLGIGLLALGGAGYVLGSGLGAKNDTPRTKQPPAQQTRKPAPDPLSIDAMRQRSYPGGQITIVKELKPRAGCATSIISYPSEGLTLYALMQRPSTPPPNGGYPIVFVNHGYYEPGTYRTDTVDYGNFMGAYCQAGFLVLRPDYRGHGLSEGALSNGNFAPDYTYDVMNLVGSLKTLPNANANRIGMAGHSMGAHVTLRAIAISDKIRASVMAGGVVASAGDILYNWNPNIPGGPGGLPPGIIPVRDELVASYGDPRENRGFWHDISAINYLEEVRGPVQIHHGTYDESVPVLFSQRLAEKLQSLGKPHELFIYEGGNHQFTLPEQRRLFLERSVSLFRDNL